jgi:thioredoxin 1
VDYAASFTRCYQTQCGNELKLVGVNADQNFKLSNTYRLKSLPTLLLIEKGIVKQKLEGFRSRDDLRSALEEIKLTYTSYQKIDIAEEVKSQESGVRR